MNFEPTLSIIFLCHNNEHIDVALDSVIEQIDCNDEIIIVDDHSNKSTLCILKKYSNMPQIRLIKSPKIANRSHNRNLGAQSAINPILVFLDGDMVLGNQSIMELKNAHYFREEKAFIGQKHGIHYDDIQMRLYSAIPNYIELLSTKEGRDQLEKNPLFIDKRSKYFEDSS